jgi:DUF4097 and DUF4098 domain-containing protein YvlB
VTSKGARFGKIREIASSDSKKSRGPKYEEVEETEEARTVDIRGEAIGVATAAAEAAADRRTRAWTCSGERIEKQAGS